MSYHKTVAVCLGRLWKLTCFFSRV